MSDWGLRLVTGPCLISWLVPLLARPHTLPLARLGGVGGARKRGWKDRLDGWMARWIASSQ